LSNIQYLSDTDSDYRMLEEYLATGEFGELEDQAVYASMTNNPTNMAAIFKVVAAKIGLKESDYAGLLSQTIVLPTRFENPSAYRIVDMLVVAIKNAAKKIGVDVSSFPSYSSIPTGLVNAQAVSFEGATKKFLLFDSQLFHYCNLYAKAFSLCLPVKGAGEGFTFDLDLVSIEHHVKQFPECVKRFVQLLNAMCETGKPGHAEQYFPDDKYLGISSLFRSGMELFVVGHEFGHVYAKHLGEMIAMQSKAMIGGANLSEEHRQEFEADAIGLILMCHAQAEKGYDASLAYIGAELFFHALEMENRFRHALKTGRDAEYTSLPSETHPSHEARRLMLRKHLPSLLDSEAQVNSVLAFAEKYENIVSIIWKEVLTNIAHKLPTVNLA